MNARVAGIALALLFSGTALTGCGGGGGSTDPGAADTSLKNGDDVEASQDAADAKAVAMGDFAEINDGVRVSVSAMKVGGDDSPWLEASVRVENPSKEEVNVPTTGIVCTGEKEVGGWQADSTLDLNATIPAGSYKEGIVNLLVPGDGRTGEKVPACTGPAYVQFEPNVYIGEPQVARVQIPDATLAQFEDAYIKAGLTVK